MTRFADPAVYQCPQCRGYLLWGGVFLFGMHIPGRWSDGATLTTGLPDMGSITCCPSCTAVLWQKDLEAIGVLRRKPCPMSWLTRKLAQWNGDKHGLLQAERDWNELPSEWSVAKRGTALEYHDLQRALRDMTKPNSDREIFIRRRIWRATNDHLRHRKDGTRIVEQPVASDADRSENMERLIALNEQANSGLDERAELLRQLGRFDEAVRLLTSGAPEIRSSANAAWILRWAKKSDSELKNF